MENTYIKIDEQTLEVTKPAPVIEPTVQTYERSFIENQIIQIQKQKDEYDALRDKELQECADILVKMNELKIVIKPTQEDIKPTQIIDNLPITKIIN